MYFLVKLISSVAADVLIGSMMFGVDPRLLNVNKQNSWVGMPTMVLSEALASCRLAAFLGHPRRHGWPLKLSSSLSREDKIDTTLCCAKGRAPPGLAEESKRRERVDPPRPHTPRSKGWDQNKHPYQPYYGSCVVPSNGDGRPAQLCGESAGLTGFGYRNYERFFPVEQLS